MNAIDFTLDDAYGRCIEGGTWELSLEDLAAIHGGEMEPMDQAALVCAVAGVGAAITGGAGVPLAAGICLGAVGVALDQKYPDPPPPPPPSDYGGGSGGHEGAGGEGGAGSGNGGGGSSDGIVHVDNQAGDDAY